MSTLCRIVYEYVDFCTRGKKQYRYATFINFPTPNISSILYSVLCSSFMQRSSEHLQGGQVFKELRWRATFFSVNRRKCCITGMPPPPPFNEHVKATASSLIQYISICFFDFLPRELSSTNTGRVIHFVLFLRFS